MTIPAISGPQHVTTSAAGPRIVRFVFGVGETRSSPVWLAGNVLLKLRFPASGMTAASVQLRTAVTSTPEAADFLPVIDDSTGLVWSGVVEAGKELPIPVEVGRGIAIAELVGDTAQLTADVTVIGVVDEW